MRCEELVGMDGAGRDAAEVARTEHAALTVDPQLHRTPDRQEHLVLVLWWCIGIGRGKRGPALPISENWPPVCSAPTVVMMMSPSRVRRSPSRAGTSSGSGATTSEAAPEADLAEVGVGMVARS